MREARPADARGKAVQMREAKLGRLERQGPPDKRGKAGQMSDGRQFICARQG
jgi:hypothetical protein